MGEKLMKYYKFMHDAKGLMGSVELAKATKIPSIQAAMAPDSGENIKLFRESIKTIMGTEAPFY